ncbi:uncharacterized protein LOC128189484 [Crassostrea angulata]|uniref:uncharacterized protein LOC128189484 n=1 Tax=Magallana angulata TaxID=2784310 RepID=UPI0022B1C43A|nr:uncharacterized protein LOC128189484 [Crassostrea angulata]
MNVKLSQSRPCIWSVDKMYKVFLLVAMTAPLFPGTVQLHCCIPSQLETYVDELSFVPGGRGSTVVQNMSYDAVTKRKAFHVFGDSIHDEYDVIIDYRANMSYLWAKGVCNVTYAGPFHEICFTGGKLVRKSFMGVFPDIIKLNTYLISSERFRWSITVGKTCTPVELRRQNDDFLNLMRFYNMTVGIRDESVFTPPKICSKKESRVPKTFQTPLFYRSTAMRGQFP